MKSALLTIAALAAFTGGAHAAIVINFGSNTVAGMNNYATPPSGDYTAGAGNFTTSTTGTTGASGTNYNTVQVFNDTNAAATGLTLNIHRTSTKVFDQTITSVYDNSTAVSDISTSTGVSSTNLNSALTTFIASGGGTTTIDTITLGNLGMAGNVVTLYFGASTNSSDGGTLSTFSVTGGTGTASYAGQGGTGFDQATLAGSGPGRGEMTLLKWVGTVGVGDSLTVTLNADGNRKAGPGFVAIVPEPSSAILLGLGSLALLRRRR